MLDAGCLMLDGGNASKPESSIIEEPVRSGSDSNLCHLGKNFTLKEQYANPAS